MPDWLTLPRLLLCAVPAAMLLAASALAAGERRAGARRARQAIGQPAARVEEGTAGELVVIEGRLEIALGPCDRFEDGAPAAAATVEASRLGAVPSDSSMRAPLDPDPFIARSARAAELVLVVGSERVALVGPVDVHVGSREMDPGAPFGALAPSVRERIALVAGADALPAPGNGGPVLARPLFRSLHSGARVRAAGVLVKRSEGDRTGYRDHARFCLTGDESAPIALAYEGTPRFSGALTALARGIRRIQHLRAALLAAVVLGAFAVLAALQHQHRIQPGGKPAATSPAAAPHRPLGDAEECAALARSHAAAVAELAACSTDDDCKAESRGGAIYRLEGCYRFKNRHLPADEAERIQDKWMRLGCATGYELCPPPPPAMCSRGRCVDRPPPHVPETWHRVDELGVFSLYLPPETTPAGDAEEGSFMTVYRGAGIELSAELGGPGLGDEAPGGEPTATRIGDQRARVWRLARQITVSFDDELRCIHASCPSRDREDRLTLRARCDTDAACADAWLAILSLRFW